MIRLAIVLMIIALGNSVTAKADGLPTRDKACSEHDDIICKSYDDCRYDLNLGACVDAVFPDPCKQHHHAPDLCRQTSGCQYDPVYIRCVQGGNSTPCAPMNFQRTACNQTAGCQYLRQNDMCMVWTGEGATAEFCAQFNRVAYQCQPSVGCFYEGRTGNCTPDLELGTPPK